VSAAICATPVRSISACSASASTDTSPSTNEALAAGCHQAEISQSTVDYDLSSSAKTKPDRAMTLGMADILQSRQILLVVSGARKAKPMRQLMDRDITTGFPASLLWLHRDTTCIVDSEAYSLCDRDDLRSGSHRLVRDV
jgi:6-phosphogluconolactonase/glucosamine-6-phosphate isomerase/deaminase